MCIWNLERDAPPESIKYRIQIQIWIGFRVLWIRPVNAHPLRRPRGDLRRSPVPKSHVYYVHTSPPSSSVNCYNTGKSQSLLALALSSPPRPPPASSPARRSQQRRCADESGGASGAGADGGPPQGAGAARGEPRRPGPLEQRPLCHTQDGQTGSSMIALPRPFSSSCSVSAECMHPGYR